MTGGSRGLGKAIAERLAAEGAVVAITARTLDPDPKYVGSLRETCEGVHAAGGKAVAIKADLSSAEDRERLWAEVTEQVGAPDILVNNAAVTFPPASRYVPRKAGTTHARDAGSGATPSHAAGDPGHAQEKAGMGADARLSGRGAHRRAAVLGLRPCRGVRRVRTCKAALGRLAQSFAAELYDDGIAVNAAATTKPVATPGAGTLDLAKEDTEDISYITETAFLLCTGDPAVLSGRVVETQPFLRESGWLT